MEPAVLAMAEQALRQARTTQLRLEVLREFRIGRVARCAVNGDENATVVVKVAEVAAEPLRGLTTVWNEQAALTVLGRLAPGLAPRLLAAAPADGVVVMEDLGDGPSLAQLLLAGDPVAAWEVAVGTAGALGDLHAATVGHAEEYYEERSRLGVADPRADRLNLRGMNMSDRVVALPDLLVAHDLPPLSADARAELDAVLDELAEPGEFLALSGGDPCPDNERITSEGVRFFDFEAAVCRHALADSAHYRVPFPNCWCWRALPADLATAMVATYRQHLAAGCPDALDDRRFGEALTLMTAGWLVWTLHRRLPDEHPVMRRRTLVAVTSFVELSAESGTLGQLADWAATLTDRLEVRWQAPPAVTYPAFGGPPFMPVT